MPEHGRDAGGVGDLLVAAGITVGVDKILRGFDRELPGPGLADIELAIGGPALDIDQSRGLEVGAFEHVAHIDIGQGDVAVIGDRDGVGDRVAGGIDLAVFVERTVFVVHALDQLLDQDRRRQFERHRFVIADRTGLVAVGSGGVVDRACGKVADFDRTIAVEIVLRDRIGETGEGIALARGKDAVIGQRQVETGQRVGHHDTGQRDVAVVRDGHRILDDITGSVQHVVAFRIHRYHSLADAKNGDLYYGYLSNVRFRLGFVGVTRRDVVDRTVAEAIGIDVFLRNGIAGSVFPDFVDVEQAILVKVADVVARSILDRSRIDRSVSFDLIGHCHTGKRIVSGVGDGEAVIDYIACAVDLSGGVVVRTVFHG